MVHIKNQVIPRCLADHKNSVCQPNREKGRKADIDEVLLQMRWPQWTETSLLLWCLHYVYLPDHSRRHKKGKMPSSFRITFVMKTLLLYSLCFCSNSCKCCEKSFTPERCSWRSSSSSLIFISQPNI